MRARPAILEPLTATPLPNHNGGSIHMKNRLPIFSNDRVDNDMEYFGQVSLS